MKHPNQKEIERYIGLDLGDKESYVWSMDREGNPIEQGQLATREGPLRRFFSEQPYSVVVIEVGTHSPWVNRLLEECGHDVVVANPRQLPMIYKNTKKSDRKDAERLARLARVDRKLLSPIHHRGIEAQAALSVLRSRDALVRSRTLLINHVRNTAKSFGKRLPSSSAPSFHYKVREHLPEEIKASLLQVLEVIEELTQKIRLFERSIRKACEQKFPETQRLMQVPGVGHITALVYVLVIECRKRFRRPRDVAAYLGLIPRRDQSGAGDPELRITKAGDSELRRLLVSCAQYILSHETADSDLRRWGLKLCERGAKNAKKRAVVAVARKLSVLLFVLWANGRKYEPLRNERRRRELQSV